MYCLSIDLRQFSIWGQEVGKFFNKNDSHEPGLNDVKWVDVDTKCPIKYLNRDSLSLFF